MVNKVEMALDEIIKSNKKEKMATGVGKPLQKKGKSPARGGGGAGRGRGAGRAAGRGAGRAAGRGAGRAAGRGAGRAAGRGAAAGSRRGEVRGAAANRGRGAISGRGGIMKRSQKGGFFGRQNASKPKNVARPAIVSQHAQVMQQKAPAGVTKMDAKNLDFKVSDKDMNELFSEFGKIKSASVHYNSTGKSLGTATIVFERGVDALKAINQYNGVLLDGRKMSLSIDGLKTVAAAPTAQNPPFSTAGRGQARGGMRGGARGRGGMRGGASNVKRLQASPKKFANGTQNKGKQQAGKKGQQQQVGKKGQPQQAKKKQQQQKKKQLKKATPVTKEQLDKEIDAYLKQSTK